MAQLWNFKTKEPEEVDDAQVTQSIAAGTHTFLKGQTIPVVTSYGQTGTIAPEEAAEAFKSGNFRFETEAEQLERAEEKQYGSGFGNDLRAGLLGFARGATLGISDQLLEKTGILEAEELRKIQERNPAASIAGEATSFAASALMPAAGASTVAKLLGKTGRIVTAAPKAATTLSKLTTEAVENSALISNLAKGGLASKAAAKAIAEGAGSAVEGAMYGAGHLISEEALGNAEFNAENILYNVGLGAVLGGAVGTGSRVISESAKAAKNVITKAASKDFIEEIVSRPLIRRAAGTTAQYRELRKFGQLDDAKQYVSKVLKENKYSVDDSEFLGIVKQDLEKAASQKLEIEKLVDETVKLEPKQQIQTATIKNRVEKEILSKIEKDRLTEPLRREITDYVDGIIADHGETVTFLTAAKLRRNLQDMAPRSDQSIKAKYYRELAGIWNTEAETKIDPLLSKIGKADVQSYKKVKKEVAMLDTIKDNIQDRIDKTAASAYLTPFGLQQAGIGAAAGAALAGDDDQLMGMAQGAALGLAGKKLINLFNNKAAPAMAAIIADRGARMAAVEKTIQSSQKSIQESIGQAIKGVVKYEIVTKGTPEKPRNLEKEYQTKLNELSEMSTNLKPLIEGIQKNTAGLGDIAPKINMAVQQKSVMALQYLQQTAPKPDQEFGNITPAAKKWKPSDRDMRKWLNVVKTVSEPKTIAKDLAKGTLTTSQVEAIKKVYPELYVDIAKKLITESMNSDKPLSANLRYNISLFTGNSALGLPPAALAELQKTYSGEKEQPKQMIGPTLGGIKAINTDRLKTSTQRIMEK